MLVHLNGTEYDLNVIDIYTGDESDYYQVKRDVYKEFERIRYVTTRNKCRKVSTDELINQLNPFILKKYLLLTLEEAEKIILIAKKFYGKILD